MNCFIVLYIFSEDVGEASTSALTSTSLLPTAAGVAVINDETSAKVNEKKTYPHKQ